MTKSTRQKEISEAADMFKALSDPARLCTLIVLSEGEHNVSELAELENDKLGTVSARLKVLLQARLVTRRRQGREAIYAIADAHVMNLIANAMEHARETH